MVDDTRVFEKVTKDLLSRHHAASMMKHQELFGKYSWVEREMNKFQRELGQILPQECAAKLNKIQEYFKAQETITSEAFYKQGFADGISLVMQSFMRQSSENK